MPMPIIAMTIIIDKDNEVKNFVIEIWSLGIDSQLMTRKLTLLLFRISFSLHGLIHHDKSECD